VPSERLTLQVPAIITIIAVVSTTSVVPSSLSFTVIIVVIVDKSIKPFFKLWDGKVPASIVVLVVIATSSMTRWDEYRVNHLDNAVSRNDVLHGHADAVYFHCQDSNPAGNFNLQGTAVQ
jgi:hypothetical protein